MRWLAKLLFYLVQVLPGGRALRETRETQVPINFEHWFYQRVLGYNSAAYWPMHRSSTVTYAKRVRAGIETSPGWSPGCMINAFNGIFIGDYTQISQNVSIMSANHDPYNLPDHFPAKPIRIGRYCLLGFGCVILPEVELGDYTIVGANAVVTRSYPGGYVVLAGAPAKVIGHLDPDRRKDYRSKHEYHGYIAASEFAEFEKTYLKMPNVP